ncbi:unnamed protein product [Wickerhamomyces anomalus]
MNGISVDINHLKKGEVNVTDKLTQVNDKIWCCRSGSAADTQAVADIVKYHLELYQAQHNKPATAKIASAIFQELTYTNKDMLTAGLIVAGYDEKTNGEVYSIPLGGSVHRQNFAIAGSGSSYIYGWTDENYKEDMTKEECVQFIKTALTQAIQWDGSSGGVIRQVILTKEGIERLVFYPDGPDGFSKKL